MAKAVSKTTVKKKEVDSNIIEVKIASDIHGVLPAYAHDGDLGLDVVATGVDYDELTDSYMYHTGIYMESDKHVGCFLFPRSSNKNTNSYLANSIGVIETFLYRGEICFCFKNRDSIESIVNQNTLMEYLTLPWYKKLFAGTTTYNKIWAREYSRELSRAVSYKPYNIGDRIGQLIFFKDIPTVKFKVVNKGDLSETKRGTGGFGHTGK